MNRRDLLKAMMAGGVMTAAGLWMPGQKLISIPSGKVFGNEYDINSMFRLIDRHTVEYIGGNDKVASIAQFYDWLRKHAMHMLGPGTDPEKLMVSLEPKYRMLNPEHLDNGTLAQNAPDNHCSEGLRELWTSGPTLGSEDLITDKVYYSEWDREPRTRISVLDNGYRGYR